MSGSPADGSPTIGVLALVGMRYNVVQQSAARITPPVVTSPPAVRLSRILRKSLLLAVLCLCAGVVPAAAQDLLSRFEATPAPFSPDGDGHRDSTSVSYVLADTSSEVSIIVFAADSVTAVDTLLAPAPLSAGGTRRVDWRGKRWDGSDAPEATYVITISARGVTRPDTVVSRLVFLDVTRPSVAIPVAPDPDPFAPNLSGSNPILSVWFTAGNVSPVATGRTRDRVAINYLNPSGAPVAYDTATVRISPPLPGASGRNLEADGTYEVTWDASEQSGLVDGEYTVEIAIEDAATGIVRTSHSANFDMTRPALEFTSPKGGARVAVVPDSLYGWTWDRNGIDTLTVRYRDGGPHVDVVSRRTIADTVYFAVPLADSFATPGEYTLGFRSVDPARRLNNTAFEFVYDISAPEAPALTPFDGVWRSGTFPLEGTFTDEGSTRDRIRVYRNGVVIDTVFTLALEGRLNRVVPLVLGRNVITATLVDAADNESQHSNAVVVDYANNAGLFIPSPFTPGAVFNVNVSTAAAGVTLRVYDLTGDLVVRIESGERRAEYVINWDGRSQNGDAVKKGPLVAVATVAFDDGRRQTYRELFLFDPDK